MEMQKQHLEQQVQTQIIIQPLMMAVIRTLQKARVHCDDELI